MSKRLVAVDAHVIEGRPQGSRTTLISLLRALAQLGHAGDIALYCSNPDECRSAVGEAGFAYVQVPQGGAISRLAWTLPRALGRNGEQQALWQYISSPFFRGRNVVVIHDVLPYTHPDIFPLWFRIRCQLLFYFSMLTAGRIVTVSEHARSEIARLFPRFAGRVCLVPNGPSFPEATYFAEERPTPRGRGYVLAVGRIEARKNIDLLTRAFLNANLSDVGLVVVGRRDLGFNDPIPDDPRIELREDVSDAELIELYRGASLFVMPSRAEGFGLPLLDATLFGIPSLASNQTALPEVAGGLAELFDPTARDAEDVLSDRIREHFTTRPVARPNLEQRRFQAARFSWRNSAEKLLSVLRDSTGPRHG